MLAALSYKGVLSRGFALVRDESGHPLHDAARIAPGQRLAIEFADGRVGATADGGDHPPATDKTAGKKTAPKTRATDFGVKKAQGDLF